ncbi:hypothetical protein QAD02_001156 [Eretmocerus hayati]|uniref:Uncharacterized protein n=1 Tax=Eretmocerus hayati TaxID=131215 RepID=A0ACC2NI22_9HYME|nr:hypothetical protein QAD02_001156 [Eretmocerus hayati]
MAGKQPELKELLSSRHAISKFSGETKINLTEYEYRWVKRNCAKVLKINRMKVIMSPDFITHYEGHDCRWIIEFYPLSDVGGFAMLMRAYHTYRFQTEEVHLIMDLLDKNGEFVNLKLGGQSTFKNPPYIKISRELVDSKPNEPCPSFGKPPLTNISRNKLAKCLVDGNLTIIMRIVLDFASDGRKVSFITIIYA